MPHPLLALKKKNKKQKERKKEKTDHITSTDQKHLQLITAFKLHWKHVYVYNTWIPQTMLILHSGCSEYRSLYLLYKSTTAFT